MATSAEIVQKAFDDWTNGTEFRSVASIFAPEMTWEIVGHSAASASYETAQEFQDKVLTPFARRFDPEKPFRPVRIRGFYADGDTIIAIWDGEGTTVIGTTYRNTYAWIMTLRDGLIVNGTAFYDSISFNELWKIDPKEA
ncbi:MAG: nuclear transport factor 2 family protein [Acidimicrobiales bacterium]